MSWILTFTKVHNFALTNIKHHLPFFRPFHKFKQVLLKFISVILIYYFAKNFASSAGFIIQFLACHSIERSTHVIELSLFPSVGPHMWATCWLHMHGKTSLKWPVIVKWENICCSLTFSLCVNMLCRIILWCYSIYWGICVMNVGMYKTNTDWASTAECTAAWRNTGGKSLILVYL